MEKQLPAIPAKRYFTIGEVSDLCGVKPYVLRYWEQEFTQLKPMKRRGNRRYYQHHEVLLIRRIRDLLYDQGFTISGARNQLGDLLGGGRLSAAAAANLHGNPADDAALDAADGKGQAGYGDGYGYGDGDADGGSQAMLPVPEVMEIVPSQLRAELLSIRALLTV